MDCGLFHLMEDFILREVDYSQKYGYSSRAKRYMRRKLNKELAPYIEEESQLQCENETDADSDNQSDYDSKYDFDKNTDICHCESILIPKTRVEICFLVSYLSIILTFYGVSAFIMTKYSNYSNECKSS
uniref:Uncharacterized protein n=1 Tax=viral metagenome TaxID=1070528 RepID=A0A6C0D1Y0_9ZZZZ